MGKTKIAAKKLKATPELEDFRGKYESGKAGLMLLEQYFKSVEKLISKSKLGRKAKGIEIGCGEGLSTQKLVKMLPKDFILSASEYVKHQIKDAKANNPGIKITEESIYDLQHKDNTFDIVFLLEVLEHLDYPDKALEEVKRVVKPGGHVIIGVPREPLWRALNMARAKYIKNFGNTPGHLNHWSTTSLVRHTQKNFGPVVAKKTPLPWSLVLAKKNE